MKFGIVADIHGNEVAFDAVLKKLEDENVDKIIILGDFTGGAPMSENVVKKIMKLGQKAITVIGNREGYIIHGLPRIVHDENEEVSEEELQRHNWIKQELSSSSLEFISKLPRDMIYETEGNKIYISHYPLNEEGRFRKHIKNASADENERMFSGIDANIFLYGHTHEEIYNVKNNKMYINPGTLGCPGKTNLAPYGILSIDKKEIKYNQLYSEYNVQEVIDCIKSVKFPGYKNILKQFFGTE